MRYLVISPCVDARTGKEFAAGDEFLPEPDSHRDRKFAIRLIRLACADRTGPIAGAERVSVLTAGKGPEVDGPADSFEQAQDFKVSFDEPAF